MTIACQTANAPTLPGGVTQPTTLSAQSMTITPSASPCYDPCTVSVSVTWINDTGSDLPAGQLINLSKDGVLIGADVVISDVVPAGGLATHTFTLTGLMHNTPNLLCPVPN